MQAIRLAIILAAAAWYLNRGRGIGWMFALFVALVVLMHYALKRTKWGRAVYAVGGNQEFARRAGIDVSEFMISTFVLGYVLHVLGGMLLYGMLVDAYL